MNIYQYFRNLDKNTQLSYYVIGLALFIILNGFTHINNQTFFSLCIVLLVMFFMYTYKRDSLDTSLNTINKYDKHLNLQYFKYIRKDIKLVILYNSLLPFAKIDKYNFNDSMISTNRMLKYYSKINTSYNDYNQILQLAKEEHDSALNYLTAISYSLSGTMGIKRDGKIEQQVQLEELNNGVTKLKEILDQYIFQMTDIARNMYENMPITNTSMPVHYDSNEPSPNKKTNVFDIYYGVVEP